MKYECGNCGNGFNDVEAIEGRDSCPFCGTNWSGSDNILDLPPVQPDSTPYPYWKRHIWREDNEKWTIGTTTDGSYDVEIEIVEEDESEYFSQLSE
jgi:predicted  nucleic acid-binding Zn-ribbon protein